MAMEDAIPMVAHTVRHLVGKGKTVAQLIEDVCDIIVGVGDQGDGEAYVALLDWHGVEMLPRRLWKLEMCHAATIATALTT